MASIDDSSNMKKTADGGSAEATMWWIELAAGESAVIKKFALCRRRRPIRCLSVPRRRILCNRRIQVGILIAAWHPGTSCAVAAGIGLVVFRRPRRFLVRNTRRLFMSEESLLSDAEAKVNKLRRSINLVKNESRKKELEKQRKWKQDDRPLCLKEIIKELPGNDASRFRSEVSTLVSQVKQEKKVLTQTATKIINYGIVIRSLQFLLLICDLFYSLF